MIEGLLRVCVGSRARPLAAAGTATPRCLPVKGKGVRTGGRLHPGLAGERLLDNAQLLDYLGAGASCL